MERFGFGIVSLGVVCWVIAGAAYFAGDRTTGLITYQKDGVLMQTAGVAAIYSDKVLPQEEPASHAEEAWEGVASEQQQNEQQEVYVQAPRERAAWLMSAFRGFGALFSWFDTKAEPIGSVTSRGELPPLPKKPSCVITVSPISVEYNGSATISWVSRNADHVILQGYGEIARSGTMEISGLKSGRTFALAVGGEGGGSSCYTVVQVEPVIVKPPSCSISADPVSISAGDTSALSWQSEGAIQASLDGRQVPTFGSITITPVETTTYTLSVESLTGKTVTCDATVEVATQ